MQTDRRHFLSTAAAGALATTAQAAETVNDRYRKLDEILAKPVLKKELFKTPVIIDTRRTAADGRQLSVPRAVEGRRGRDRGGAYEHEHFLPDLRKEPSAVSRRARMRGNST